MVKCAQPIGSRHAARGATPCSYWPVDVVGPVVASASVCAGAGACGPACGVPRSLPASPPAGQARPRRAMALGWLGRLCLLLLCLCGEAAAG